MHCFQIYSSCYDSTLRSHDFETGISEEVVDADSDSYDGLLHSFDFDPTGNEIWGEFYSLSFPLEILTDWILTW